MDMEVFCHKHPHKQAKYYITKTTPDTAEYLSRMFCSRCAIKLVTKGLMVEEIANRPEKTDGKGQELDGADPYQFGRIATDKKGQVQRLAEEVLVIELSGEKEQKKKKAELGVFLGKLEANKRENEGLHEQILSRKQEMKEYYNC